LTPDRPSAADRNAPLSSDPADPRGNALLAAVPTQELSAIVPRLRHRDLPMHESIYAAWAPIERLLFPVNSVLSQTETVDGSLVLEVGTIGREGMTGLAAFLGAESGPIETTCQVPGRAWELRAEDLPGVLADAPSLVGLLHRFIHASMVQLAQNTVCIALHTTEERAARWLLMTADRVGSDRIRLTQEFLSQMLGVRRATVTVSAGLLQGAGLISYSRGRIDIVDRGRLREAACGCYEVVRDQFERVGVVVLQERSSS